MTMHIRIAPEHIDGVSLPVYINDLDYRECEYDEMYLSLNGVNLKVPKLNNNGYRSGVVVFKNLETSRIYQIKGKVKYNGEWFSVIESSFIVPNKDSTKKTKRFPSGGIMSINGDLT